ncbi:MAG TPA: HlyD family secretion protein [Candidatus Binatia bacterium]|nr:HlyD family secretion protein [Candidatus Binatia bacterium]
MAKLVIRAVLVLIIAAGALGGGAYWWKTGRFQETTDNAYVEGDISVVSPLIEGRVAHVLVGDNQAVKVGDVLVTIEDDDYRAKVAQADASLAAAQASISTIDSEITWQQTKIDQIVAQQRSAAAELNRAKTVYDRYKKMIVDKVIGTQELDEATASYLKAQAAISETSAQLAAEQTQLGVYQASRKEAEAKQMEAAAAKKLAEIDLDRTVIKAPIDGVIGNRAVRVGQYVKAGTQLLSLVPNAVHVVANFKETQLDNMRPGQQVEVSVDAFPSHKLLGTVESFAPASGAEFSLLPEENATGNFTKIVRRVPVRIALPADNPLHGLLRPGLSVVVDVDTRTGPGSADAPKVAEGGLLFGAAVASDQ